MADIFAKDEKIKESWHESNLLLTLQMKLNIFYLCQDALTMYDWKAGQ